MLILLALARPAIAGPTSVTVLDGETGLPVAGAEVQITTGCVWDGDWRTTLPSGEVILPLTNVGNHERILRPAPRLRAAGRDVAR